MTKGKSVGIAASPISFGELHFSMRVMFGLTSLALAACGSGDQSQVPVAARINSSEITMRQVNDVLAQNPDLASADLKEARRLTLERLIDQQLAFDQALDRKLDRSPDVIKVIDAAKRQILAQAYLQQVTGALPKPGPREIRQYFDDHPELFAERQVYELRAIALQPAARIKDKLDAMVAQGKSLEDVSKFLVSENIPFKAETATRAAEQLPLEVLPKLAAAKQGRLVIIDTAAGFQIVLIADAKTVPVDFAEASGNIERYLFNQRAIDFVQKDLVRLRKLANIEYPQDSKEAPGSVRPVKNPPGIRVMANQPPENSNAVSSIELTASNPK